MPLPLELQHALNGWGREVMKFFQDDRKQSFMDVFPSMQHGQVNVSYIPSNGAISAFHAHQYECWWFLIKGSLKVGVAQPIDPDMTISLSTTAEKCKVIGAKFEFRYLSDKNSQVLRLPHKSYHGYMNIGSEEAILLYWLDKKWTPMDDFKLPVGSFGENWKIESK